MAKTFDCKGISDADLTKRKTTLIAQMRIPGNALRASRVSQFLTCGKKNCRCQKGHKHGPFQYLVQCLGVGRVRKFLLKTTPQKEQAGTSVAAYVAFQEQMEQLSQINTELLRRGLPMEDAAA
jgi:hypothetical protein